MDLDELRPHTMTRRDFRLGLAFWLVDYYKPAGYPFGKTMKGLRLYVRLRVCQATVN